jgi:hypothetical protein
MSATLMATMKVAVEALVRSVVNISASQVQRIELQK